MKKISSITITVLIICTVNSYAQWTNGYDIYNTTTGLVGIGTSSPGQKLTVENTGVVGADAWLQGKLNASNAAHIGLLMTPYGTLSSSNLQWSFGRYGGTNDVRMWNYDGSSDHFALSISGSNGNVGIGTTTPTGIFSVQTYPTVANGLNVNQIDGDPFLEQQRWSGTSNLYYASRIKDNSGNLTFELTNNATPIGSQTFAEMMRITPSGNVGIGTRTPSFQLDVSNVIHSSSYIFGDLGLYVDNTSSGINNGAGAGYLSFRSAGVDNRMTIDPSGKVGIGTTTPDELLAVKGNIYAQEVKVDLTGWEDRVFKRSYKLPTLSTVKTYINLNHHIPDMPSEHELVKTGLNVGNMEKILTKKVEELTLYLIEKDKQLEEQNKTNQYLQHQLDWLKQQIAGLTQNLKTSKN